MKLPAMCWPVLRSSKKALNMSTPIASRRFPLWNAAVAGLGAAAILDGLDRYSKYPIPGNVRVDIGDYISLWTRQARQTARRTFSDFR